MSDAIKLFEQARMLCSKLTKMAISGNYTPGEYTTSVGMVRDALLDLAQQSEFGLVKELADHSTRILDQSNLPHRDSEHYVKHEDFLYHIQVLPSAPSGLINHIGIDRDSNGLIVESAIKSREVHTIEGSIYAYRMMQKLSEDDDVTNWNKIAAVLLKHSFNTETVLRAFSHFKVDTVVNNSTSFTNLQASLVGFQPGLAILKSGSQKINEQKLLDNLLTIGEKELIQKIASASYDFQVPLKLHKYAHDYGFEPDADYLQILEKRCRPSSDNRSATVCTSLYAYLLSAGDHEIEMNHVLTPEQLIDIFSVDGTETEMGTITYDKRKASLLIDVVMKEVVKGKGGTALMATYEKQIPKNILMLSNFYKGLQLSDQLGL